MTLRAACDIGAACGLTTTLEAAGNIETHCISMFDYDKIDDELKELWAEYSAIGDIPIALHLART